MKECLLLGELPFNQASLVCFDMMKWMMLEEHRGSDSLIINLLKHVWTVPEKLEQLNQELPHILNILWSPWQPGGTGQTGLSSVPMPTGNDSLLLSVDCAGIYYLTTLWFSLFLRSARILSTTKLFEIHLMDTFKPFIIYDTINMINNCFKTIWYMLYDFIQIPTILLEIFTWFLLCTSSIFTYFKINILLINIIKRHINIRKLKISAIIQTNYVSITKLCQPLNIIFHKIYSI